MIAMPRSLARLLAVAAACATVAALTLILTHVASAGGAAKISSLTYRSKSASVPPDDSTHSVTAKCPTGLHVLGGGIKLSDPNTDTPESSFPKQRKAWVAQDFRPANASGSSTVTSFAICGN